MTDIRIESADWQQDQQQLIALRTEVFVDEQKVPVDMEIDGMDPQCLHVKAVDAGGNIIGTARLLPNRYVGRMCVKNSHRKQGVGGNMLQFFIDYARQNQLPALMLNAQISAQSFYQAYGFEADSKIFMEADIEHIHMTLLLSE
jgi:predicted GNAT family N-acyltransferase